jgi:hypothetical protein
MTWFGVVAITAAIGLVLFRLFAAIKQSREHSLALAQVKAWRVPGKGISVWQGHKFLVLVNPFGGSKSALQRVYLSIVRPMLTIAHVDHDAIVTTHAGHVWTSRYITRLFCLS